LKEQGDKVPADDRQKIEDALKRLKDALAGADIDAVKSAHETLLTASNEFTRKLYENVQAQQSAGGATGGPGTGDQQPSDDEVADAEIIDDDQQTA
jgi:molecular chaperone DnaK